MRRCYKPVEIRSRPLGKSELAELRGRVREAMELNACMEAGIFSDLHCLKQYIKRRALDLTAILAAAERGEPMPIQDDLYLVLYPGGQK